MTRFLRVRLSDPPRASELLRMQDNVGAVLDSVVSVPTLGAVQINKVDLSVAAAGATRTVSIEHGLGHPWTGWSLADLSASAIVHRSASANPEKFLTLTASADVVVSVLIW